MPENRQGAVTPGCRWQSFFQASQRSMRRCSPRTLAPANVLKINGRRVFAHQRRFHTAQQFVVRKGAESGRPDHDENELASPGSSRISNRARARRSRPGLPYAQNGRLRSNGLISCGSSLSGRRRCGSL